MASEKKGPSFKVHAEEDFLADLEAIVERDFYPDLPKLRAQQRYLDARASVSMATTTTALKTPLSTPSGFEDVAEEPAASSTSSQRRPVPPTVGLDSYLAGNTSEDNASFQALLDESERRRRLKYAWFYQQADALKAIKSGEEADETPPVSSSAAIELTSTSAASSSSLTTTAGAAALTAGLDSWPGYQVRSALMYSPDDAVADAGDVDAKALLKLSVPDSRPQIVHANTRFRRTPFPRQHVELSSSSFSSTTSTLTSAPAFDGVFRRPAGVPSRIGPDGRELGTPARPAAASYLATPSPAPGVNDSPLMTWGDIDGTPCRLDESTASGSASVPSSPASSAGGLPYFRIPAMPTVQLADKLGRHRRLARQRDATRAAASQANKTLRQPSPASMGLSPAAKRLLKRSAAPIGSFGGDKALRASYRGPSPSPSASPSCSRRAGSTAASGPDSSTRSNASLTDGLLSDA